MHAGPLFGSHLSGQFSAIWNCPAGSSLCVGSGSHALKTAEVMKRPEPVVIAEPADGVIVVGDVNSTLAAALVAAKLHGFPFFHVGGWTPQL